MKMFFFVLIAIYSILFVAIFPFVLLLFVWRFFNGKENKSSILQRFCLQYFFTKAQKYDVWIHAASVGEVKSAEFLIKKYIENGKNVLVTTGTVTSRQIVLNYSSKQVHHKFLPIDFLPLLILFLLKHKVKNAVVLESEIWPNLFFAFRLFKIKTNLLNVDISKKSQLRWQKFGGILREILKPCNLILTQNNSTTNFIKNFHKNVKYLGNVKLLNLNENYTVKNENIIKFCTKEKSILTVASTHEGEDEPIIQAIAKVKNEYKIIYVPRHPHRVNDIAKILEKYGIKFAKLSQYDSNSNCILVDSIGSLMDALSFSHLAIYGGGFLPHLAGHNVLEAGIFKCKVITGYYVEAFEEIIAEVKKQNGIIQTNANLIYEAILQAEKNNEMGQKIYEYILQNKPNLEKIFAEIGV